MPTEIRPSITGATTVDELMSAHKATIRVFIRHRMMCIGCPVARIHDLAEACREHGVPLDGFLAEVSEAIAGEGAAAAG